MRFILLLCAVILTACSTTGVYKSADDGHWRNGYKDMKLSSTQVRVTYLDTDQDKAYKGFLHRAADLTLQSGHKYFSIKDVGMQQETGKQIGIYNMNMPQYQATVTFEDSKTKDNYDASETLKNVLAQN